MFLDLFLVVLVIAASALAVDARFCCSELRTDLAETRVALMHLVRSIEHRAATAGDDPYSALPVPGQLRLLAADLRSDFPDYFPPEVGGFELKDERDAVGA